MSKHRVLSTSLAWLAALGMLLPAPQCRCAPDCDGCKSVCEAGCSASACCDAAPVEEAACCDAAPVEEAACCCCRLAEPEPSTEPEPVDEGNSCCCSKAPTAEPLALPTAPVRVDPPELLLLVDQPPIATFVSTRATGSRAASVGRPPPAPLYLLLCCWIE